MNINDTSHPCNNCERICAKNDSITCDCTKHKEYNWCGPCWQQNHIVEARRANNAKTILKERKRLGTKQNTGINTYDLNILTTALYPAP